MINNSITFDCKSWLWARSAHLQLSILPTADPVHSGFLPRLITLHVLTLQYTPMIFSEKYQGVPAIPTQSKYQFPTALQQQ